MMLLLMMLGLATAAWGQVSSAVLFGELHDQSSAVVPGVVLTARQETTGFTRTVVTGADGGYRIGELPPGAYTVTAAKEGFRTVTARRVVLEVNQKARLDLELMVGHERDTMTVTAAVSPLRTEDASQGYLFEGATITALPLAGRNVISLVTLGPGAIPRHLGGFVHDVINDLQEGRGAVALNAPINGGRSTMNAYLLDGAYDTDRNVFAIAVTPPMESVQEFRIQSSLASAEFAQAGGGVVDLASKFGGQRFHGSAFELFRNEAADARNFFDDPALPRPVFRQNQFGGSLGGPLPLPATFFFTSYEGLCGSSAKSALSIVPDAALRSGDFRAANPIFDPLGTDSDTGARLPFPNNIIPAGRIDPIARKYLDRYEPLPNRTGSTSNYLDATPNQNANESVSARLDHQFRNRGQLFARYTVNAERGRLAGAFPELPTSERVRAQQVALGHASGRASWSNEARFSFTRLRVFDVPESAFHSDVARELGLFGPSGDPFQFGLPYFLVTNFSTVTDSPSLPQVQRDNTWHAADSVSLARGRRILKAGFEWVHFQFNYLQSNLARGRYTFTGAFTAQPGSPAPTGDPFADFLLGFPQVTSRNVGSTQAYMRQNSLAGYLQHDWRATDRLTVNLGLRYEFASPFTEKRDNLLNLDYSALPAPPGLERVRRAAAPDHNNFAPRAGLAWRLPRGTVFRAGYGVYFSPEIAIETYDLVLNGIRSETNETNGAGRPILTMGDGFPRTASTGFPNYFGLDSRARTPYVQQWTAGFQRELAGHVLAEISYVGSKGTKLGRFRQLNTPLRVETGENLPPREGDLQALRPFPALGKIVQRQHISNSSYHSLQLKAEKRMGGRVALLASFVWSKSIDDADSVVPGMFDSVGAQDERNLRLERGLSFFDVGRRVSSGLVCDLPKRWRLAAVLTLQDGTPLNPVYFAFDPANSGTPNRPDVVPGQAVRLPRSQRTADRFFNTDAFRAPRPYTFGNAGRDILPGPGNNLIDLALHRRFPLRESAAAEFRVEVFNAFNHPNWGIPGPYPDFGPFFGKIFSSGDPRRAQLGLRFDF